MNNANNNSTRPAAAAASPIRYENAAAAGNGPGLPPEMLGPRLADLKRQLALRQAMP